MLTIREVTNRKELRDFVDFPHRLYKDNPYWVPALRADEIDTLDWEKNPAFEQARARYWLAWQDGIVVGRIAAIFLNHYEEKWGERRLRFGWYDFIDEREVAGALMAKVEEWAQELNVKAIHGPMGFSDMDPEGLLTEGYMQLGSTLTLYNNPYYVDYIESMGFEKDVDWVEYAFNVPKKNPLLLEKISQRVQERTEYRLLKFKSKKQVRKYIHDIFSIYNQAYDHLYAAVPLTDKQIDHAAEQYLKALDSDYIVGIVDGEGKIKGFGVAMVNINGAIKRSNGRMSPIGILRLYKAMHAKNSSMIMLLIGLAPELKKTGAVSLMLNEIVKVCHEKKIRTIYCMPELEQNTDVQKLWKFFHTEVIKKRRAYVKHLHNEVKMEYDLRKAEKKLSLSD